MTKNEPNTSENATLHSQKPFRVLCKLLRL
jgi:hypothetical protein